jgi:hypothetical protein
MPYPLIRSEKGPLDGPFLNDFGLWIAVPSGDTWHAAFAMSLLQVQMQVFTNHIGKRTYLNVQNQLGSMLSLNRESMIEAALASDENITHILMLDSDMTFPADTAHWLAWRNQPIVMGGYNRRCVPTTPTVRGLDGKLLATLDSSTGLEPVLYGGLGCCMVHREVFEKVPRPWFHFEWVRDPKRPGGWGQKGEDVYFFDKCRQHGYDVLLDHDLSKHLTHVGLFEYTHRMAWLDEDEDTYDALGRYTPEVKLAKLKEEEQRVNSAA